MPALIWFVLGGIVGGIGGVKLSAKAAQIGIGVATDKLSTLPEPCRSQVRDALLSVSEADVFNTVARIQKLTPEEIEKATRTHPPSTVPFVRQAFTRHLTSADLIREYNPTPEQLERLRAAISADPHHLLDEDDIVTALDLTPAQRERLRHLGQPGPWPSDAAGALWMHHGYYDPIWPRRVYGHGYGY